MSGNFLSPNGIVAKPATGRSEYGRVKVALPRGKGLMDWVRLTAGKALAKKRLSSVNHEELMKHNTVDDCWVTIFGQVYDVTSYLEFHPGGVKELMRAAGRDGTHLFNEYHAWVNYESMLKACYVGKFSGDVSKLPPTGSSTVEDSLPTPSSLRNVLPTPTPVNSASTLEDHGVRLSWNGPQLTMTGDKWEKLVQENVIIHFSSQTKRLRVYVRLFKETPLEILWDLNAVDGSFNYKLLEKFSVDVADSQINVTFQEFDTVSALFSASGAVVTRRPKTEYYRFTICQREKVNRDTVLFHLEPPSSLFYNIPTAHHCSVKIRKGMSTLYRPYTPVSFRPLDSDASPVEVKLLIKIYSDGIATPSIDKLDIGDVFELSDPIGDTDYKASILPNKDVIMLAAGTGLTPMVSLLAERLRSQNTGKTRLILFNKTESDIVSDHFLPVRFTDPRMEVCHVLSAADENWTGERGRVSKQHIPPFNSDVTVAVCGPDGFTHSVVSMLFDAHYKSANVLVFKG